MRKKKQTKNRNLKTRHAAAAPLNKRKLWVFRLVSIVLIPIFFFGILEAGLRCIGFGYSPHAVIKQRLDNKEVYCHNYKFGWLFFPPTIARYFDGFVFDTYKTPNTYRIFLLGASAAAGVPAQPYNFGHMLEVMLDELYPEMDFEVHTVAMPAINSHAVVEIANNCAKYQPDLYIVYLGNNEVVGPYGPGTVFSPLSPSLSMIRSSIAFKSTRTGQLVERAMRWTIPDSGQVQQWGGMEMFLDKQIRYDDPAIEIAYGHFEKNLMDICQTGLNAGAAVIVSNVATNLKDCPPFASLHRPDFTDTERQSWQKIYTEGVAFEAKGQYEQAIAKYRDAERIDSNYAELQFRLARCYWNTGDFQKAKEKYTFARDYDALRFRADSRINEIIHSVAGHRRENKLFFVDSIKAIDENSSHLIPGKEVFYEHVHLNFKGNYILANSMLPWVRKTLPKSYQMKDTRILNEKEVADLIGYTDYERVIYLSIVYETFLKEPPFTNRLDNEQALVKTKQTIDSQLMALKKKGLNDCLIQHKAAVQNRPNDWQIRFQYAAFLNSGLHNIKAEEEQLRKVIKICPYYSAYLNLGINLHKQGKINESESVLRYLLEINPNAVWAHIELASICRQRREYMQEIQHLLHALSLEPKSLIEVHLDLARAYEKIRNPDKAIDVLNNAVRVFPEEETANVHALMSYFLYGRGEYTEALKEIQHAFRIDPTLKNNSSYNTLLHNLENMLSR